MVRLVFRPYTQVKRSICTSESLRASTRVSPGFALLRHSSPSFGSQQICSYSNLALSTREAHDRSMEPPGHHSRLPTSAGPIAVPLLSLRNIIHCRLSFHTRLLAYMLDSLVRVSRRAGESRFVRVRTRFKSVNTADQHTRIQTTKGTQYFVHCPAQGWRARSKNGDQLPHQMGRASSPG